MADHDPFIRLELPDLNTQELSDPLEDAGITRSEYNRYVAGTNPGFDGHLPVPVHVHNGGSYARRERHVSLCVSHTEATTKNAPCRKRRTISFGTGTVWTFRPSSGQRTWSIDDSEFMYFGWWSRQDVDRLGRGRFGRSPWIITPLVVNTLTILLCQRHGYLPGDGCGVLRDLPAARQPVGTWRISAPRRMLTADFDADDGARDHRPVQTGTPIGP